MPAKRTDTAPSIEIVGADANNLRNVDAAFPLGMISAVTGVSGSGKSSLLTGTLAAEGGRRMRTFLGIAQEGIEGEDVRAYVGPVPPTILVGQRGFRPTVRTTVGTASGFLATVRRLFLRASAPYAGTPGHPVPAPSPEAYAEWIVRHYRGPAEIWAAPIRAQRTDGATAVARLAANGVEELVVRSETDSPRLRESGRRMPVNAFRPLNPRVAHTIEARIGMVDVRGRAAHARLLELLREAFAAGNGSVVVMLPRAASPDLAGPFGPRLDTARHRVDPGTAEIFASPSAHLLSFNAPEQEESGACPACAGTGTRRTLREAALVAHPGRSMHDGALALWTPKNYRYVNVQHETIEGLRGMRGFSPDVPWRKLSPSARALVLDGSGGEPVVDRERSGGTFGKPRPFAGFRSIILEKAAGPAGDRLAPYVVEGTCDTCGGSRWSFQARALRVGGVGLADILATPFANMETVVASLPAGARREAAAVRVRADDLVAVGLGYLTADRGMLTVSEGESRRIRLSRVLHAPERGLCLLLDEPARGLHESDIDGLAGTLEALRGRHTVILNEHRERLWRRADWNVEVGPGAGEAGGTVTYSGPPRTAARSRPLPLREALDVPRGHPMITIRGASIHNVRDTDCAIPLGRLTCVTGVSGSGKSSFVRGVLAPALLAVTGGDAPEFALREGRWRSVKGASGVREVVALDQAMPHPNRRSIVATFSGIFDGIRQTFGTSAGAKEHGLGPSDFGMNAGEGRCSVCLGIGEVAETGLWSACPACGGSRFGLRALSVRARGVNIAELLSLPADRLGSLAEAFGFPPALAGAMKDLGIGHVAFGRRIDTLSGGEIQRLRLAMRLHAATDRQLFILDEPAAGLHELDVGRLLAALERVLDGGRNTVVLVEHDLRLIRSADWIVEFGPGGGPDGGRAVFSGTPAGLARSDAATGRALRSKTPVRRAARSAPLPEPVPSAHATTLIRALLTGDARDPSGEARDTEPGVVVDERFWNGRRPWEVAGLDLEIPKLLLDIHRPDLQGALDAALLRWEKEPGCRLAIHPYLGEMQTWGAVLPTSVRRAADMRLADEGLHPDVAPDVRHVRATGPRFSPERAADRRQCLLDALAIGGRYVEVRAPGGRVRSIVTDRLLDLDAALVAPMTLAPSRFSRHDPRGRCPMCAGTGTVAVLPERLIIGNAKTAPAGEGFLTPQAAAVMRSVRRNELLPFLARLVKEGLWNAKKPFEALAPKERALLLFGCWSRPGAGSFLKTPRANPAEAASWLRWDGLHRRILAQSDRSHDAAWTHALRKGTRPKMCPDCAGTGLPSYARLLRLDTIAFPSWARIEDAAALLAELRAVPVRSERQRRALRRILLCLGTARPATPLDPRTIARRAVGAFTTMRALDEKGAA